MDGIVTMYPIPLTIEERLGLLKDLLVGLGFADFGPEIGGIGVDLRRLSESDIHSRLGSKSDVPCFRKATH